MGKKLIKIFIIILSSIFFLEVAVVGVKIYADQQGIELFPRDKADEEPDAEKQSEEINGGFHGVDQEDEAEALTEEETDDAVKTKYTFEEVKDTDWNESGASEEELFLKAVAWLQNKPNVSSVDFTKVQYLPNSRNTTLVWDNTAYARLASLNPYTNEIRGFSAEEYTVDDVENNAVINCMVLTNLENGYVEKIIAQESAGGRDMLTYYFFDGLKLRCVIDSRSTGGELEYENQYSFADDTMVELIMEKSSGSVETYDVRNYSNYSELIQSEYDGMEAYMLNRAYMLCACVSVTGPDYGAIRGYVKDADENPITHANVEVFSEKFDTIVAVGESGVNGFYSCNVPIIGGEYTVKITGDDDTSKEYSVEINNQQREYMSTTMVLE